MMTPNTVRILFLSDTHLGFDLPFNPRVKRARRGADFFKNIDLALSPALNRKVDCVVHGGDLFYRSKIPQQLVQLKIPLTGLRGNDLRTWMKSKLAALPANSVVKLIPDGLADTRQSQTLTAQQLRDIAPSDMIVQLQNRWRKQGQGDKIVK